MQKEYDYIIAGAGCAGLSLLMRMMNDSFFDNKKILVVDADTKNINDRTWCFWEKEPDIFEPIVHHQWNTLNFFSKDLSKELAIYPYSYKMIEGLTFYNFVKNNALLHANIHWINEKVINIVNDSSNRTAGIQLSNRSIFASKVFNSILFSPIQPQSHQYNFQQHFKGWVINTPKPSFNPGIATFMDFRVSQKHGTTFMYLLPTSTTSALVEYTLFTKDLLPQAAYDIALKEYIHDFLEINDYTIAHEEYGIIPMTNMKLPLVDENIVFIGIAGGQAKGSSGYAFKFIQKKTAQIINALKTGRTIPGKLSINATKGLLYDSTLLHVLHHQKMPGDQIFSDIFKFNNAANVLSFLDNESSFFTDLQIMSSVPTSIFLPAALKELLIKIYFH